MTGQLQQNHDPSARVRALLIAVDTGEYDAETSLGELSELADTAGAEVAATMIQRRIPPTRRPASARDAWPKPN